MPMHEVTEGSIPARSLPVRSRPARSRPARSLAERPFTNISSVGRLRHKGASFGRSTLGRSRAVTSRAERSRHVTSRSVRSHQVMNGTRLLRSPGLTEPKEGTCRIAVLGAAAVGKTALTVRFLTKRFIGEYSPTLESVYRYHTSSPDDDDIRLDILDSAGQPCTEWKDSYALWADCFLFVYSITDHSSFQECQRLRRLVEAGRRSTSLTCVVVGNKNDLVYDRKVTARQGQELAAEIGCSFYEVSACDWNQMSEVCDIFIELHALWRKTRVMRDGRQRKSSSSTKFRQAIQKVISGKGSISRRGNNSL